MDAFGRPGGTVDRHLRTNPLEQRRIARINAQRRRARLRAQRAKRRKPKVNRRITKYALLIGSEYVRYARSGQLERLPGCHDDIRAMRKMLVSKYGYRGNEIKILWDVNVGKLAQHPTKGNISSSLRNLVNLTRQYQLKKIVVYYSGHGTQVVDNSGDEADHRDECVVPSDFLTSGMVTDDWLNTNFLRLLPAYTTCTFVSDSCNSGTLMDISYNVTDSSSLSQVNGSNVNANVLYLSGCADPQTSASAYNLERKRKWRGAMTWALEQILKRGYRQNIYAVWRQVKQLLSQNGFSQVPQLSMSKNTTPNGQHFF